MDAGPVLRHVEESIDREDCTIVLSGYQPEGGFAWKLQRGADRAQINGKVIPVRAQTVRLEGLSGHADQDDLLAWLGGFGEKPSRILINHGIDSARTTLAARIGSELGIECALPSRETSIEI
jgi:metallo-beta-lactamase family protein